MTFQQFVQSPILIIALIIFIFIAAFMLAVYISLLQESPSFATSLGYLSICFSISILPSFILLLGDHLVKLARRRRNEYVKYLKISGISFLVGIICMLVAVIIDLALN